MATSTITPCADPCVDADLWFSEAEKKKRAAKLLCHSCPVIDACLELALTAHEAWGIWGGTDVEERKHLRADIATTGTDLIIVEVAA